MAHITARYEKSHSILAGMRGLLDKCRTYFERHRAFQTVYGELSSLSDRELADIGISRSQILDTAWVAANRG